MPGLPALALFGLRGRAAWVALAAGVGGGLLVTQRVLPSLAGGAPRASASGGDSGGGATAELLAAFAKAIAGNAASVATAALGPGASLGMAGVRLAGDVTDSLARVAERETTALVQTNTSLVGAIERTTTPAPPSTIGAPTPPATSAPQPTATLAAPAPAPITTAKPIVAMPAAPTATITPPVKLAEAITTKATGAEGTIPKGAIVQIIDGVPISLSNATAAAGGLKV